jgi:hypothetical protein
MDELTVLKKTVTRQSERIATLALDLDLAYAQIEILNEQLNEKDAEAN